MENIIISLEILNNLNRNKKYFKKFKKFNKIFNNLRYYLKYILKSVNKIKKDKHYLNNIQKNIFIKEI